MFNSLFGKLSLSVLSIFLIVTILLIGAIDNSGRALQEEAAQRLNLKLAENLVKEAPLWQDEKLDTRAVEDALHMMMVLGPANELYLVAPDGTLLNYSDPDDEVLRTRIDMAPLHHFLDDSSMLPILGDDPRSADGSKIFSAAPVYRNHPLEGSGGIATEPIAYLYIIIRGQQFDSVSGMLATSRFAQLGLGTLIAGAVFLCLTLLLMFFYLTRPVRRLAQGLKEFRQMEYLELPPSLSVTDSARQDELAALGLAINEMAARIVALFRDMLANRKMRQELLTHISHDLRTPLAGIRGYLESWQIRHSMDASADSRACINTALKNCDLLEHMVAELFELSRLEAREIVADREVFLLHELIDDLIQKYRLQAMERHIQILRQGPEQLPPVYADIGHINRVFNNLIDNALRHSRDNSQIVIALKPDAENRAISVKIMDSGSGIPAEVLPLLFEPYYQIPGRQHYIQGTGLGLAITKRLLALNGSGIEVESREQVGTVFLFCVPLAGNP